KALAVNCRSGAHTAFEEHHKARQVLVLGAQPIQDPGTQAGPSDARPAVVDEELRLRVREALVKTGADDCDVIDSPGNIRKKVRDFEPGLTVPLESPLRAENDRRVKFAVLKIFVAEAGGGALAM